MKQILIIQILLISHLSCKAQSPILSLDSLEIDNVQNAYYKDIDNVLVSFEGTWLYVNGNTSLKITLKKITMLYDNAGGYYEDLIVGGYQYIENGVEKINTLEDVNNPNIGYNAKIEGNNIYDDCSYLPVEDCIEGEKRLDLSLADANSEPHIASLLLHKRTINGQEALKANIIFNYYAKDPENGELPSPTLPWQMHDIVFIKQ